MTRPILAALALLILPAVVQAQYPPAPWPDEAPAYQSAMVMRAAINVRSIDESLKLYRDVLGMDVIYTPPDTQDPRLVDFSGLKEGQSLRLVLLRPKTTGSASLHAGYIGLSQVINADGSVADLPNGNATGAAFGAISLLLATEDVMALYDKVVDAGFDVISTPVQRQRERPTQLLMRGPDGERLWISQQDTIHLFLEP